MLTSSATGMLRTIARTCTKQPILLRSSACPYSSLALRPRLAQQPIALRTANKPSSLLTFRRSASSAAEEDARAAANASAAAKAAHPELPPLTWD